MYFESLGICGEFIFIVIVFLIFNLLIVIISDIKLLVYIVVVLFMGG